MCDLARNEQIQGFKKRLRKVEQTNRRINDLFLFMIFNINQCVYSYN